MRKDLKKFLIISLVFSLLFYIFGIITGILFGNEILKIIEKRNENISKLIDEIRKLNDEFEKSKLLFLSSQKCKIIKNFLEDIDNILLKYYSFLPYRLEEYELQEVPQWYLELKNEYNRLQLNSWIIAKEYENCEKNFTTILYFYKPKCLECIKQGEEIDKIRDYLKENFKMNVKVFTLDINFENPTLKIIKKIYNVTDAPSFIIKDVSFKNFTSFDTFLSLFLQKKL